MTETKREAFRPVVLVILDGWGIGRDEPGNAVLAADTPTMDRLWASYPRATLRTSGESVGLPGGQMGNSEVGHLNLGAGFIVYQWLTRLDKYIREGVFFRDNALVDAVEAAKRDGGRVHLIGLVSDGGVHSHIRHLEALIQLAHDRGLQDDRVIVHAITDGRDTAPDSGAAFVADLEATMARLGTGRIATVSGRYYAMDRDKRWDRTELAFRAITQGQGVTQPSSAEAIQESYAAGVTDEFVVPCVIENDEWHYDGIRAGDQIIWFNFRADRARQLTEALTVADFTAFDRDAVPLVPVTTLTRYEAQLPTYVAFEEQDIENPVAKVVSDAGLTQLHTAETEKYAHVTYFFNGGREEPFPGERRRLVPSPKVATYDLQPEMSAPEVCRGVVEAIRGGQDTFIIVNFANCDMVGHTGVLAAAIAAVETVDRCLGEIVAAITDVGGAALVTADHGNAEEMINPETGGPMTAHTKNPVPVILVTPDGSALRHAELRQDGVLSAVAPTVLELLGLTPPPEMTQPSLIARVGAEPAATSAAAIE